MKVQDPIMHGSQYVRGIKIVRNRKQYAVIFLPARPASQTHDSHKGRMILNHVNPAGRIKNCGEKSAFKNLQLSFLNVFLLAHRVLNNIGKNRYRNTPQQFSDHYFP